MSMKTRFCIYVGLIFVTMYVSHSAMAVTLPANPLVIEKSKEESKLKEQEIDQRIQAAPEDTQPTKTLDIPSLLIAGECQIIKRVWLYGADELSEGEEESIVAPFLEKCIYNSDISQLVTNIQKWYLDHGYITTRINVKQEQNSLDKGNLEIWVVEGRLGNITLGENTDFDKSRVRSAFPVTEGAILSIHDLDQGLEQLNRLFSQTFRMKINPATKPGFSDIELIESSASEYAVTPPVPHRHFGKHRLGYQYSNSGVEDTGEHLHGLSFTRENLIGVNDVFSLSHQRNIPFRRDTKVNESERFGFKMPWGYWLFDFNYSKNESVRKVVGESATFFSKGDIGTSQLSANYVFDRDRISKTELSTAIEYSDRKNYINDTLVEVSSRRIASVDLGLTYTHYFPQSTMILSLTGAKGMDWFGALDDESGLPDEFPKAQYTIYKLFSYYRQQFLSNSPYPFSIQHSLNAQYTSDTLYGEKQFVIGGEYSIRGFNDNVLSSDGGWTLRNDFNLPIGHWSRQWQKSKWVFPLNAKIFYDVGRGRPATGGKDEILSGAGIGVSYRYRWFDISYTRAKGIKTSDLFEDDEGWVDYIAASAKIDF